MNKKVIITGVTGMVGEGVLHECLKDNRISEVLVVGRRASGYNHPKLKEVLVKDFFHLAEIESAIQGYDACYFCLGVSSVGMKEADFFHLTYELTLNFASLLSRQNGNMVFCYISGAGTDSSEKGRTMWARVKGKTENDLQKLSFQSVYLFRPGYMQPTAGMKNTLPYYRYISWMYPMLRFFFKKYVSTLTELGKAMIAVTFNGYPTPVIEVKDIVQLAATKH